MESDLLPATSLSISYNIQQLATRTGTLIWEDTSRGRGGQVAYPVVECLGISLLVLLKRPTDMDYKNRDTNWLSQLNTIFKEVGRNTCDGIPDNIQEDKTHLKELLYKRTKSWWNKSSLEQYVQRNLIPRGLRIQVFPSFSLDDEALLKKWEDACNTCSRTFMEILIEIDKRTVDRLEVDIKSIQEKIQKNLSVEQLTNFDNDLNASFTKWESEVQKLKVTKFQRDLNDYQNGRIYKWRVKPGVKRSGSTASLASISSSSATNTSIGDSSEAFSGYNTRFMGVKRKNHRDQDFANEGTLKKRNWKPYRRLKP
ncbi:uncharacterized protein [Ranitomeya imitator]|uniref:uncharacterized protein n=1 Tax=Ranitomeya imitator TaxID=111125 RepID=UPI0037E73335